MNRILLGCLVSPLWVPLLATVVAVGVWTPPLFLRDLGSESLILIAISVGAFAGYGAIALIGYPVHRLLRRNDLRSFWMYPMSWFVAALIGWAVVFVIGFANSGLRFSLSYLAETIIHRPYVPLTIAASWALVAATFWLIVRPDREVGVAQR